MKQGFVKVAAATPQIRVADVDYNVQEICRLIDETTANGAKIVVFPELCVTGYTCGDLFAQGVLQKKAKAALKELVAYTAGKKALVFVGLPYAAHNKLYNVAAAMCDGVLLGITTKSFLPNYDEFQELRHFQPGPKQAEYVWVDEVVEEVPFGPQLLFVCEEMPDLVVSAEICEDLWAPIPPSTQAALAGATVLVNCSASDELVGKDAYRRALVTGQSAKMFAAYVYANAGEGESTTDLVFSGHNLIAENGVVLAEGTRFVNDVIYTEIDLARIVGERKKNTTFELSEDACEFEHILFSLDMEDTKLTRSFSPLPFVPATKAEREKRCEEILTIQAMGLKKRLAHTNCKSVVVGISGGLDSTLALLVTAKAFDLQGIDREKIVSVTMPCFGTTDRTYRNACLLTKKLGATLKEVNIQASVRQHFADIGHAEELHDVTYENAQARERTQVLMDIANQTGGMVIGTGDLSELVLGWATYNGDHMSMYGVNSSIPKTLVRHLVRYYADTCEDAELQTVLLDILDTPVSPELLPPKDGEIAQKTEDLVGPYELHDFFLYYVLRFGYEPSKVYRIAKEAFAGMYDEETIYKWLTTFYRRFFSQQFKRSCLPDGPKVGSVGVSPRGDLCMPSDACVAVWLEDLKI
ncbi:MAG: NAD(+) synthase [Faecalimonas sp.]|nr:NAD(+) synthase [Faecalimonas sp.]